MRSQGKTLTLLAPLMVLVLLAVTLLLAACAGDETTTTSSVTETTEGTETTGSGDTTEPGALPDLTGESVEVAAVWTGTEQESFQQVLDAFAAETGAEVTYTSTGNDIAAVLGTRIQGGNPPDVALLPQPGLMTNLVQQGALQPIGDVVGDLMEANYAPVWKDLGAVDGTQYGMVFKAANKSTIWYNVNVFAEAGVEPPATWDDLLAVAQSISDSGVTPFSIGGAAGWVLTDWFENVYLRTAGPDMYDQLTAHEIPWTDPSVTTALDTLAEVFGQSDWIAGGNSGALLTDFPPSVTQVYASPPAAAMVYEGDFVISTITGETTAELGTDADFFTFPSIDGSPASAVAGGDTAVLLNDSAGGKALMQFLASPQAAEIWVALGGFTSPNKNVAASSYPSEIAGAAAQDLANAEVARFDMSDLAPPAFGGTPAKGEWKLLQDFLADPSDVQSIQEQLEAEAAAAYGG